MTIDLSDILLGKGGDASVKSIELLQLNEFTGSPAVQETAEASKGCLASITGVVRGFPSLLGRLQDELQSCKGFKIVLLVVV